MDCFVAEQSAKKAERREIRRALKQTRCTGYTDRMSGGAAHGSVKYDRCNLDFRALTRYAYGVNELTEAELLVHPRNTARNTYPLHEKLTDIWKTTSRPVLKYYSQKSFYFIVPFQHFTHQAMIYTERKIV